MSANSLMDQGNGVGPELGDLDFQYADADTLEVRVVKPCLTLSAQCTAENTVVFVVMLSECVGEFLSVLHSESMTRFAQRQRSIFYHGVLSAKSLSNS